MLPLTSPEKGFVSRNGSHSTSKALFQVDLICILSWMGKTKPNTRFCFKTKKRGKDICNKMYERDTKKTTLQQRKRISNEREREGESSEINLASGWGRRIWPFVQTAFTATQHFEKKFLKISTGIVVQTYGNTRAQLKYIEDLKIKLINKLNHWGGYSKGLEY